MCHKSLPAAFSEELTCLAWDGHTALIGGGSGHLTLFDLQKVRPSDDWILMCDYFGFCCTLFTGRGAPADPRALWPHHDAVRVARRRLRGHRRRGQEGHRLDHQENRQRQQRRAVSDSACAHGAGTPA